MINIKIYLNAKFFLHKLWYNQDFLLNLLDNIFANRASEIDIKTIVAELQNEETVSEKENKYELAQDVTDLKKNFDCYNLLMDWLGSLPAYCQISINDNDFKNTLKKDRLDSQPKQDLFSV